MSHALEGILVCAHTIWKYGQFSISYTVLCGSLSPSNLIFSLSVPTNLNPVFRIVWILPLISNSSNLFTQTLLTVPGTPTTIGITVTLMFHWFLVLLQGQSICQSFRSLFFSLCGPFEWINLFFSFKTSSGLLSWIR